MSKEYDPNHPALTYHAEPIPGKISTGLTKPMENETDLALAYSPGVGVPVMAIASDPKKAYDYTSKGNLVGVVSNGSAILGLGNQGPLASKPVMEGKAALFKKYGNVDAYDIEIDANSIEKMVEIISAIAPTFGGINLEDIKAPECFEVEKQLIEKLDIPVFHDDQHGTAITMAAALLNALKIQKKSLKNVNIVIQGAGASALACAHFLITLGASSDQLTLLDSRGVIHHERNDLNAYKQPFARITDARTLEEAMLGADVFVGLAGAHINNPEHLLKSMNDHPVIFTLSNPTPAIAYDTVKTLRPDGIVATGLSNHPNQVNNVVCFPYIFRGALDARATKITDAMKIAATHAIADIAQQSIPDDLIKANILPKLTFGSDYILPKPYDPRLMQQVPKAVSEAWHLFCESN